MPGAAMYRNLRPLPAAAADRIVDSGSVNAAADAARKSRRFMRRVYATGLLLTAHPRLQFLSPVEHQIDNGASLCGFAGGWRTHDDDALSIAREVVIARQNRRIPD